MHTDELHKRFARRTLLIATMHEKERVMAPILERALGVQCITLPELDTDRFGTFSGEVERTNDPLTTLRMKCNAALKRSSCDLVVGNEGSFGPHPVIGMIPADEEWMMLIDSTDGLEVHVRTLRTETNFSGQSVESANDLLAFAERVKFPSHALILRAGPDDVRCLHKGIQDETHLLNTFESIRATYGQVFAETDMRALYNPTRMQVIGDLTEKLVNTLRSNCPHCKTPGFQVVEAIPGLPCSQCGLKTRSIRQHRYRCIRCGEEEYRNFPSGKELEDPMYCDFCNP